MQIQTLKISTLSSSLPNAGNHLEKYYPTPMQLGAAANNTYDAYWGAIEAMLLDDEIAGDLETRKTVSASMPWVWYGTDAAIENTKALLQYIDFDDLIMQSLSCVEYGFNPIEIMWHADKKGFSYPIDFVRRAPRLFRISNSGELLYLANSYDPITVPAGKVMVVLRSPTSEKPYGESLLESVWPTWQVKWNHVANLDRLGEKYAVPTVIATTKSASNQAELDATSETLASIEGGAGIALGGVDNIHQLTISGKATELVDVIKFYDNKICKRITGQTLTTGNQEYGSRALGEVFERATLRISASDLKVVIKAINLTLLRWLKELNPNIDIAMMKFDDKAFNAMLEQSKETLPSKDPLTLSTVPDEDLMLCL
ncbi:DUF935 domain-containing protein [Photobacterium damselae subsp. damselae]|uniref:phage portal protein family protein n=1 Tax=Photobacterium damselae TaxID=38293 RepID=UPI001F2FD3D1|nr:DUF935 family protein [Photobacterium damselae]UJZ95053.1 DUF935 domain-containing protein [Photobacterium damselae subsp. damselae]UJZ99034.1 DUF935 domain-containing protein [Photobacterium damselae subsp. damselae]